MKQYYVLFNNHENGMRLKKELNNAKIKAVIAPTPRKLSKCCGISLMIEEEDIESIRQIAEEMKIEILEIDWIEKDFNASRDRYC